MDWRVWTYSKLTGDPTFTALVPAARIFAAGSLRGRPDVPFVVLVLGGKVPVRGLPVVREELLIHAHDDPGDYGDIDEILQTARGIIEGPVTDAGAIDARFQGTSPDLADDALDTITRNMSFQLLERSANT